MQHTPFNKHQTNVFFRIPLTKYDSKHSRHKFSPFYIIFGVTTREKGNDSSVPLGKEHLGGVN